jgi:hypothetical protein
MMKRIQEKISVYTLPSSAIKITTVGIFSVIAIKEAGHKSIVRDWHFHSGELRLNKIIRCHVAQGFMCGTRGPFPPASAMVGLVVMVVVDP